MTTSVAEASIAGGELGAPRCLARAAELAAPALAQTLRQLPEQLQLPVEHHLEGGGKRVRAALVLLSAAACGGDVEAALPGAVAIELVHNFSLIHDDIIDNDTERRHRPTVWAQFGIGPAIVSGDALVVLALQHLLEDPTPLRVRAAGLLAGSTQVMIGGQASDMAFEATESVSFEDCLEMAWQKTGALLSCAGALGAVLSGAGEEEIVTLAEYGTHVGIAFQAVDDLLGIWGEPAVTGKPVGSDLRDHKKTLPVVAALASANGSARGLRRLLDEIAGQRPPGQEDGRLLEEVRSALEASGAREAVEEVAEVHLHAAIGALADVPLVPGAVKELSELAYFVVRRNR